MERNRDLFCVSKTNMLDAICLLIIFIPYTAEYIAGLNTIVKYAKWAAFAYAILTLLNSLRITGLKTQPRSFNFFFCVYMIATLVSVIANGQSVYLWFSKVYPWIATVILVQRYFKRDYKSAINCIAVLFCIIVSANMVSWFLNGSTIARGFGEIIYFMGIRTRINDVAYVAIAVFLVNCYYKNRFSKTLFVVGFISLAAFIFFEWVSTGLVSIVLMAIIIILGKKYPDAYRRINKIILLAPVIICFLIMLFNIQEKFSWLIVDILGEDLSLNGRTLIWGSVLNQVHGIDWIIGKGLNNGMRFTVGVHETGAAHNQFLSILVNNGIVGLSAFLGMAFSIFSIKTENKILYNVFTATIIVYFISGISEITCDTAYYISLLTVAYTVLTAEQIGTIQEY